MEDNSRCGGEGLLLDYYPLLVVLGVTFLACFFAGLIYSYFCFVFDYNSTKNMPIKFNRKEEFKR